MRIYSLDLALRASFPYNNSYPYPLEAGSTSKDCFILFFFPPILEPQTFPVCELVAIISDTLSMLAQRLCAHCLQTREVLICHRQIIILYKSILHFVIFI